MATNTPKPLVDPTTPQTQTTSTTIPKASGPAGATSSQSAIPNRSIRRTPGTGRLRPKVPKSPHLNRAFEQRHALTPGRRKSRQFYKESPRDWLRELSRKLPAPTPHPVKTPRRISEYKPIDDDDDDTLGSPPVPSSTAKGIYSDDDVDFSPPPRVSLPLSEGELTPQVARRAMSERPYDIRSSLGFRNSDVFRPMSDNGMEGDDRRDDSFRISLGGVQEDSIMGLVPEPSPAQEPPFHGSGRYNVSSPPPIVYNEQDTGPLPEFDIDSPTHFLRRSEPLPDIYGDPNIDVGEWEDEVEPGVPEMETTWRQARKKPRKVLPVSDYGHEYPPLPPAVIKKLAITLAGGRLSADTMKVITEVSDQFFRQTSSSLRAFAEHAGRRTIDDADAIQLFLRQRQINNQTTIFSLAQKHLPRELAHEIRMRPT